MSQWYASVDTAFLLNLEQGAKEEIEVFERLHLAGYKIRFAPVVSHELIALAQKGGEPGKLAAGFIAKQHIYKIDRLELDRNQLDYSKHAAECLLKEKILPSHAVNVAHLIGESACRENGFLISDLGTVKSANWKNVQECLVDANINPIRRFSTLAYLKGDSVPQYSKPTVVKAKPA